MSLTQHAASSHVAKPAPNPSVTIPATWPQRNVGLARSMFAALNGYRLEKGEAACGPSKQLRACAQWQASFLAHIKNLYHDDPADGYIPARLMRDRFAAFRWPVDAKGYGENACYGFDTAALAMAAFHNDAGHEGNLLNPSWTVVGIGAAVVPASQLPPSIGRNLVWFVQDFGA